MRRSFALAAFLTTLAAAAGALSLATPAAGAEPAAVPVAVVDLLRCVREHPAYSKAKTKFVEAEKAASAERDTAVKDFEAQRSALMIKAKEAPGFLEEQRRLELRALSIKFQYEWAAKVASEEYLRALVSIYEQVRAAVAAHARANRILLVLQMTDEKLQAKSSDEFTANVIVRSAVYWDPNAGLDITKAVIASFAAGPAPGPAGPANPPK